MRVAHRSPHGRRQQLHSLGTAKAAHPGSRVLPGARARSPKRSPQLQRGAARRARPVERVRPVEGPCRFVCSHDHQAPQVQDPNAQRLLPSGEVLRRVVPMCHHNRARRVLNRGLSESCWEDISHLVGRRERTPASSPRSESRGGFRVCGHTQTISFAADPVAPDPRTIAKPSHSQESFGFHNDVRAKGLSLDETYGFLRSRAAPTRVHSAHV